MERSDLTDERPGDADDDEARPVRQQSVGAGIAGDDDREANLHLRQTYALGNRSCGRSLVDFVGEGSVVYPVAHHVAIFNLESRSMEFVHPTRHVKSAQCFHVSPNRELLAVAEVCHSSSAGNTTSPLKSSVLSATTASLLHDQDQHMVSIYNLNSRARIRSLPLPAQTSIASCSFSADNKFLAVLEDSPAHNLTYWKVSNAKLIASCKCASRGSRVRIHPLNGSFLSVSGPTIFKYWVWTNHEFKISNFLPQLREQEHFVDHVWLKHYMVTVSERGLLLAFRSSTDLTSVDLAHSSRCRQPSYVRLECLAAHAKGFVVGGSAGFFSVYEASDDPKDPFPFVRAVSVGDIAFDCLAVSPGSETVVACAKSRELLHFPLSAVDTVQEDVIDYTPLLRHGNHVGSVLQVDSCVMRPVLATCGTDKTVRVWNVDARQYELVHSCGEEPSALAIHPSGFLLLVAFKERTRVYHVLHASLRPAKDLPIKACKFVRYSHGGHFFACAAGLTIRTFRSYTGEPIHTLSGHIGAVRYLSFSADDVFLFSAGHDGAIYRWSAHTGARSEDMQHIVKQCQYAAFVVDCVDPSVVVAAGNDGKLREIVSGEEATVVDLAPRTHVTALALMRDNRRLFAGTNSGSVLIFAWPLRGPHIGECYVHAEAITHMRITETNEQLAVCSEDGSVSIFRVLDSGIGSPLVRDGDDRQSDSKSMQADRKRGAAMICDAVLVAREDLEEKEGEITEMQQQYEQVKADVEFALHRKENEWVDRLHVVKDESETLVVQERTRFEELEARHQHMLRKHSEELSHLEANHVKMTQELENQYERKLAQEVARYDALSETLELTRQRCEALVESQDHEHRGALHAERKAAYSRSKEQNDIIKRLHDDLNYNHAKFEEVLRQEETDYESELHHVRAEYEQQLSAERQNTAIKQGQLSATSTKLEAMKKKMQELKAASHARDMLLANERAKVAKLESSLAVYESHFEVTKLEMEDKDKVMAGLQSSNRVLESFRSVLSHRIDNLEKDKAPMEQHVHTLETHIRDMQTEMADEYKLKGETQQDVEGKDAKVRLLLNEVKMLRQGALKKEYSVGEMTREFARLAQISNLKDLAGAVKDAYRTFVIGEVAHKKPPKPLVLSSTGQDSPTPSNRSVGKRQQGIASPKKAAASPTSVAVGSPFKAKRATESDRATTAPSPGRRRNAEQVWQQPGDPEASGPTDEELGYDTKQAVAESVKQAEYMSRTITTLRAALDNANAKADRIRRDSVAEGSQLIEECNKLRKENKTLAIKIRDLERALNGFSSAGSGHGMHSSQSSPQICAASPQSLDSELSVDVTSANGNGSSPYKLLPLSVGASSKHKHAMLASPSPSPTARAGRHALPFARVEMEREMRSGRLGNAGELTAVVDRQKREIQRLQAQVQLLLSDSGTESSLLSSRAQPAVDQPPVSARAGSLRPLSSHQRPLQSSFVLTTPESGELLSNQDAQDR